MVVALKHIMQIVLMIENQSLHPLDIWQGCPFGHLISTIVGNNLILFRNISWSGIRDLVDLGFLIILGLGQGEISSV